MKSVFGNNLFSVDPTLKLTKVFPRGYYPLRYYEVHQKVRRGLRVWPTKIPYGVSYTEG